MPFLYGRVVTSDGACLNLGPRLALQYPLLKFESLRTWKSISFENQRMRKLKYLK